MNASGTADEGKLVSELASRVGTLGVELADVAGNLEEVTQRVGTQAEQFKELQRAAETMVSGNREIDRATKEAQQAASAAGTENFSSATSARTSSGRPDCGLPNPPEPPIMW